mmetsp:Transcript_26630/g.67113  ORF Transcript_26630/g.67113 Transcript_26630/m.67113 type:complete len:286 (+) Transcript_26630:605-1462(+)|eukprot:CAMPEP_0178995744 /NCGR_PEP_ID=MMETSP0795-20121207/7981_1 /TAXON_ID=88552 /ORGANISM="Amoebophrya sp., Strain Ameob2" /LENGTH=285 /DNA_ID=CAMNT_0020688053 /DNA_START=565 /DNA_END=1422 /DNA_ORIENTATION=+
MAPPVRPGEANIFGKRTPTAEQEALEAKREYNIKLRDERYERKQAELADQRKLKKEYEAEARQQRKQVEAMKRQTELRAGINKKQNNIEDEYRERNREAAIIRREEKWAAKTHEYIMILLDEAQEQENIEMEKKKEAKTKVLLQAKLEAKQRTETKSSQEQLEEVRTETMQKKEMKRNAAELVRIDELKQEVEEELEYKLECVEQGIQTRVTMNDLVKSLVPVPAISDLFCAVKAELDEIKYLKHVDLEPLAKLQGKPPLLFVNQIEEEHERNKLPTPSSVPAAH